MPEGYAAPAGERACFEQRILHARHLLQHGIERLANHRRAYFFRAQVAYFLDLQEIEKRIILGGGNQSGFFPTRQLTRREPQNAKQVRSTISVHGCIDVTDSIIRNHALRLQVESARTGNLAEYCNGSSAPAVEISAQKNAYTDIFHNEANLPNIALLRQRLLNGGNHLRRIRSHVRLKPRHYIAAAIEQKLREVPLDLSAGRRIRRRIRQVLV